jgi:hypothetical protein
MRTYAGSLDDPCGYTVKVSLTKATSLLCSEPLNPGWRLPCFTPVQKPSLIRSAGSLICCSLPPDATTLFYVFRGSVWYQLCSNWSSIGLDTSSASWKAPNRYPLPLAPDGSPHTGSPSPPPGLKIETSSPITLIYEGGCRTAAGADAEGPRHSGSLDSLCSCMTLHISGWHSRLAVLLVGS